LILWRRLLGKIDAGLQVDQSELRQVLRDLEIYGDAPGSSFYLIRDAQQKARIRDYAGAMRSLDRAVERTPALLAPYFLRAEVFLRLGDVVGAERDLREINRLLTEAGGFSEGDEARAQELEIQILIEKRQFKAAKERMERAAFLPSRVALRLREQLAKSIGFDPEAADAAMRKWAKDFNAGRQQRGRKRSR
jgi:predicted Zn-dependent protease